jgi:uncharacterized protein
MKRSTASSSSVLALIPGLVVGAGLTLTVSCTSVQETPGSAPTTSGSTTSGSPAPSPALSGAATGRPAPPATSGRGSLDDQLVAAAWANDVRRAARLIRAGADVNHLSSTTESAFHVAASEGYVELLNLTLAHGADVASLDSFSGTSLIRAAERGHSLVVGRLLQTRTRVNHVNRLKYTALHEAIILGRSTPSYADTVRLLVARGADVTLPAGTAGTAPLEAARDRAYPPVIATLEAALAARPVAASAASAGLLAAATSGDADAAAIALRQGAGLESRDRLGRTPLILAVAHGRPEVARLLQALGADPDTQDDRQDSP